MRKIQNFGFKEIELGVCYYPEQWPKENWQQDFSMMKEAGIKILRVGEFAWSKTEEKEGVFTFDFFDDFLEAANKAGMGIIFGTPTATPPAWLTQKYPEVLNCNIDGIPYRHGMRRHYNYNSPVYRSFCSRIVEKLAEHFGRHPAIRGWQIDNEINCETDEFYSDSDTKAFREFLKEKYSSLENLNIAWGCVFWNQTYTDWDQIFVPRPTVQNSPNPHLLLDYSRFVSSSAISFCKMQSDIIRKYKKTEDFITTNGKFSRLDNIELTDKALDIFTYDSYPNFARTIDIASPESSLACDLKDRNWSFYLTDMRSICPHFAIMEQQTGAHGWVNRMPTPAPKPGQLTLWAMQSISHGADFISFFRWRSALFGSEIYWLGILDWCGKKNRRFAEIVSLNKRLEKIQELCAADSYAQIALVKDYDNDYDASIDKVHGMLQSASEQAFFAACQLTHTPMDICRLREETDVSELLKYKVLVYPHPYIVSQKNASVLCDYVKLGGTLIFAARAGLKNSFGHCCSQTLPGPLAKVSGSQVEDSTLLSEADGNYGFGKVTFTFNGKKLDSGLFNDILIPENPDAQVLATYDNDYYEGRAALTENPYGSGRCIHFGGSLTLENSKAILEYLNIAGPCKKILSLPPECELVVRSKNNYLYYFVLNYSGQGQKICSHRPLLDMDTGHSLCGELELKAFEVKIFRS